MKMERKKGDARNLFCLTGKKLRRGKLMSGKKSEKGCLADPSSSGCSGFCSDESFIFRTGSRCKYNI
jgi:hypothetical protein